MKKNLFYKSYCSWAHQMRICISSIKNVSQFSKPFSLLIDKICDLRILYFRELFCFLERFIISFSLMRFMRFTILCPFVSLLQNNMHSIQVVDFYLSRWVRKFLIKKLYYNVVEKWDLKSTNLKRPLNLVIWGFNWINFFSSNKSFILMKKSIK